MHLLLAADIGGTKSELAIVDLWQTPETPPILYRHYRNKNFKNFHAILADFLSNAPSPEYGCLGVAGVIRDNTAKLTNLDWILDRKKLKDSFGFKQLWLINDLTAVCSCLPLLQRNDLLTIQQGQQAHNGIQAVIAPGTGLGEGFLIRQEGCFFPQGSEGGHCDFAPLGEEQEELFAFMQYKQKPVSYEMLCSGLGIPNIFDFFSRSAIPRDATRYAFIAKSKDRTPPIVEGAHGENPCPLCVKTIAVFLEILGAEAGNLALKTYATGGLFIGGGILPRIANHISFTPFLENFRRKEKMADLMASIPIHAIMKRDTALLGSISYGYQKYHKM
jgi:glucokinase